MNICYCIRINEIETLFFGFRLSNRLLCAAFCIDTVIYQSVVSVSGSVWSLSITEVLDFQHVFSFWRYSNIFYCRSTVPAGAPFSSYYLAYDIIIFDFGLMHRILGTTECVANYLDGGYMRGLWCGQQAMALILLLACISCIPRPAWLLWPALFMQSALDALTGKVDAELAIAIGVYSAGVLFNWFFTSILWHYYWSVEQRQEQLSDLRDL
ncbi:hypothetical protein M3Y97_00173600 [Aphelenchoides bicaudatus]|nr:hypothetical protein M3Y97_00173600 [Aphelenchoides bicaudatus]